MDFTGMGEIYKRTEYKVDCSRCNTEEEFWEHDNQSDAVQYFHRGGWKKIKGLWVCKDCAKK